MRCGDNYDLEVHVPSDEYGIEQTDVTIPLQPKLPSPEFAFYKKRSEIVLPEPDVLASFRAFVCAAKLGNIEIKEDVSQASSI